MKRLSLFCAVAGMMLGTASLPQPPAAEPFLLPYVPVDCTPSVAYSCAPVAGDGAKPVPAAAPAAIVSREQPAGDSASPPLPDAVVPPEPVDSGVGVHVVVSLPEQMAYVFRDGEFLDSSPVSTGKRGHRTPVGTFPILQKKVHHRSSTYDNAPMPYMQRLTWRGIALHAGELPGYPASHGCIRLPWSFAKKLYGLTDYDTRVTITDRSPDSPEDALSLA